MNAFLPFIMTASLFISQNSGASEEQSALKYISRATYKQMHIDRFVNKIEERYIPENLKIYGGYTAQLIKIAAEQKISFEWSF